MSVRLRFAAWRRLRGHWCECCSKRIRREAVPGEDGYFCAPCAASLLGEQVRVYLTLVESYAAHDSWRCGHPDRYPQAQDCPCGLLGALENAGIDPEPWRNTERVG